MLIVLVVKFKLTMPISELVQLALQLFDFFFLKVKVVLQLQVLSFLLVHRDGLPLQLHLITLLLSLYFGRRVLDLAAEDGQLLFLPLIVFFDFQVLEAQDFDELILLLDGV